MLHRLRVFLLIAAVLSAPALAAGGEAAVLYKTPDCGCCDAYADYLRASGFTVTVIPTPELARLKEENGVPQHLAGCHTTRIGRYIFEGHIPVESIERVLREQPPIKGLSVPGMPPGSPGMTGTKQGPLNVYRISDRTPPTLYESH